MRLALDNHYSPLIAERLRERGYDVVAAVERQWERLDDEPLLQTCAEEQRALLTNDVADFTVLAREWAASGRRHAGVIFTSDESMPRRRDTVGRYVEALDVLLRQHEADAAFEDRVHWLTG